MNDKNNILANSIIPFLMAVAAVLFFAAAVIAFTSDHECNLIDKNVDALSGLTLEVYEYAARGDKPGGYWIKDNQVIGFSYAEDDPIKTISCFPELTNP